ncbi:MAG: DNA polymerase III subunit beta [gamma proteobacterium symbiont of Taylorina sp.]|nr:DNA polymerase III subunit beta [gamma proteobacterium symbiont of Taylorina sp.]
MKFTINIDVLLPILHSVIGVIDSRPSLAILSNFLIQIKDGVILITASDLEVEITANYNIDVNLNCSFTVPAKKFFDICKNIDQGVLLNFELKENKLVLRSKSGRFILSTLSVDGFPNLDPMSSLSEFSIPQKHLKLVIENTQFSMANQDVRYYLNGLLFEIFNNELRTISTDGHRLAYSFTNQLSNLINIPKDTTQQIIVPRKAISELNRLLDDSDDIINISLSTNHLNIIFNNLKFTSKLVDGRFPDYQRVIPPIELCSKTIIVDRVLLKQALSRISVLSTEKFRAVRLEFSENNLVALVHNPEQEEGEECVSIDYHGENFIIGFNVNYLIDALNAIDEDQVSLKLTDSNSSCLITGLTDITSKYVVMPMRL